MKSETCRWAVFSFWGVACEKKMKEIGRRDYSRDTACDLAADLGDPPPKKLCLEYEKK